MDVGHKRDVHTPLEETGFDAVELTRFTSDDSPRMAGFRALGLPMTSSSDGHYLEDIGSAISDLTVEQPSFAELALAFAGVEGRAVGRA